MLSIRQSFYCGFCCIIHLACLGLSFIGQPAHAQTLFKGVDDAQIRARLASMSLEDKIGQLFMVPAYSGQAHQNQKQIESLIRDCHVGGLIFMQGSPLRQAGLTNYYQKLSTVPLLIAMDAEWGLSMRLDSTLIFPHNMTLGAVQSDSLIYAYGLQLARQCHAMGVHINFAPVVDVNNNAENPVINDRSFGSDRILVAHKAALLMQGMQAGGVIATAKHWPGHGDTDVDSHLELPRLPYSRSRLDSLEFYPFEKLFQAGIMSVMVAHLSIPSLDTTTGRSANLSPAIVKHILRDSLHFQGLIFTDALSMKGVTRYYPPGELELAALEAGNDILLFSENVPLAIEVIKQAVYEGRFSEAALDEHVARILKAKAWLHLDAQKPLQKTEIKRALYEDGALRLARKLYMQALTLQQNPNGILPLRDITHKRIACVQFGAIEPTSFYRSLRTYAGIDLITLPKVFTQNEQDSLLALLKGYDVVIAALFQLTRQPLHNYGFTPQESDLLCHLSGCGIPGPADPDRSLIIALFGSPYALQFTPQNSAVLLAYEDHPAAQQAAAEAIFGGFVPQGTLPVQVPRHSATPQPYSTTVQRFGFERAGLLGFNESTLGRIDTLVNGFIARKAMPGCTILVMKGNTIVYDRAFGYLDYTREHPTDPYATRYDLASVSKVVGTTLAIMKLYETDKLDIEASIAKYLPEVAHTEKAKIKVRNLLLHDSGLPAFQFFFKDLWVDNPSADSLNRFPPKRLDTRFVRTAPSDSFPIQLSDSLFLAKGYPDTIFHKVLRQPLLTPPGTHMVYSDFSMMLMQRIIERITGQPLDWYLAENFFAPLGLSQTGYNPAEKCEPTADIAPSDVDKTFRMARMQGYVNDQNAALLGGVAGHAGLFSNVYDLGKLLLMLKNGGIYAGTRYLKTSTITYFTAAPGGKTSRRGLCWDKPDADPRKPTPCSEYASPLTYGHLGFTGTCVWVDPKYDLVFVLLANRTFPDASNVSFVNQSVRTKVMDLVYKAMADGSGQGYTGR